jgi:hypothetical protein
MQHHDVVMAAGGLDWEFSGLVRVRFTEVCGLHNGDKDGVGSFALWLLGRAEIERRLHVKVRGYFG